MGTQGCQGGAAPGAGSVGSQTERGPGLEWTAWAPGLERALERSLCAP